MRASPELLDAMVEVVRPMVLADFHKDTCILSSRIGMEVLRYFGVASHPLACMVQVVNQGAWEAFERGEEPDWPAGDWGIVIGKPGERDEPGRANYHVALVVEAEVAGKPFEALLDLSIDQASRPEKGIPLEPCWLPLLNDIHNGHTHVYERSDGCRIMYEDLGHDDFTRTPDWKDPGRRKAIVGAAIRQIREKVHSKVSC